MRGPKDCYQQSFHKRCSVIHINMGTVSCDKKVGLINGLLVPVAARSKVQVCGRSPAEIVGSNPAGDMDVPWL
jgi:hypothetical protein